MRFKIAFASDPPGYDGMDRMPLWPRGDVSEAVAARGMALEDAPPAQADAGYRAIVAELPDHLDVLGLGDVSGPGWESLGYDVGELTDRAWSAILHAVELGLPAPRLNRHGLFDDRGDAERFLRAYLEVDDPDRDWDPEGIANVDLYAVVPIHRLRRG